MNRSLHGCLVLAFILCSLAYGNIKLPAIISDNMVVQADTKIPIWGWADADEKITVKFGEQTKKAKPGKDGKWFVYLDPIKQAAKLGDLVVSGKNTIAVTNILVGQAWIGSGQSNMQWNVGRSLDPDTEISNANYPEIRLFSVPQVTSDKPLEDCHARWVICSPQTIADFSAVLYFYGRDLHNQLHVPVGLIHTSWGGTPAESWTSESALLANPLFNEMMTRWKTNVAEYPAAMEKFKERLAKWQNDVNEAKAAGKNSPPRPGEPYAPQSPYRPASLYNAMIAPLIPYAISGAIWYQGESNASRAWEYRTLLPSMINDWRKRWNQDDFAFYFVGLANFNSGAQPKDCWAELRQAQLETLKLPHTGMSVTIDIGEANDIHPKNKQEVGRRLALIALANDYGRKIEYSGPMYKNISVNGPIAFIRFTHLDGGLIAKGGKLAGFEIAGADRQYVDANAVILTVDPDTLRSNKKAKLGKEVQDLIDAGKGVCVAVSNPNVAAPVAVRYAWKDNPENANLYNAAGLPAVPFKTDDWPWLTENKH